uniref:VirD4-like conjugal transfer protein, CD1115 family n=1 Tax=Heyndrickxia ginsengihumi TaxID=363870 RepID=UPI0004719BD8
ALDLFFKARGSSDPASIWYATSNFAAGNTRSSIFSTAMDKLQIFASVPNAKLTSKNSLNLADIGFGDKPVAVFMVTPDYDRSNHVLASIFTSQLYRVNAEKASKSDSGKMKRRVQMILDEFGNMPPVDGMASMVTVGAGRGFRIHLVIQSYAQIKTLYGDDSDTIIGNCSNQIYILTEDKETAELYSALLGTKTITDYGRSGRFLSLEKTENESAKERALLMPDELMSLLEGESVVVRANKRQDNKRKKIKPKPIYNRGNNAAKFRWEYLSDDFDTSNNVLNLPIIGEHVNVDLDEISFASAGQGDVHSPLIDCLNSENLHEVQSKAMANIQIPDKVDNDYSIPSSDWTVYQMYSFLVYAPFPIGENIEQVQLNRRALMKKIQVEANISSAELDKWIDKLSQVVINQKNKTEALTPKQRFAKQLTTQW